MESVKAFFESVSAESGIPCRRSFWDAARHGSKPSTYFVWRLSSANHELETDDMPEADSHTYAVSVFTKNEDLESVCTQIEEAAENRGACVQMLRFEDYEKDTGYFHGELTVTRYLI